MKGQYKKKPFQPITTKLDDVALTNFKILGQKKKAKTEVPDYGIAIDDEVSDYPLQNLFEEGVLPDSQKQIVPKPHTYEMHEVWVHIYVLSG